MKLSASGFRAQDPTSDQVTTDHTLPFMASKQKAREFENKWEETMHAAQRGQAPAGFLGRVLPVATAASLVGAGQTLASLFYQVQSHIQRHEGA